ncbi:MAG: hypothetical protein ACOC95_02480 [Planctomycetota bacterium]
MNYAIGYQLPEPGESPFADLVAAYREHVAEVYFPWVHSASGRADLTRRRGYVDWAGQGRLEDDLRAIKAMGVGLDLLLNANCYGGRAISEHLRNEVASVLDHLGEAVGGVDAVTTPSPMIAHVIKTHFPEIHVRASVNMRIGTVAGMSHHADLFDSFYIQRDYNRDLDHVRRLKRWADAHGKDLLILANSGCLAFCSGQTFHDNLVAHEADVDEMRNITGFSPMVCRRLLADRANWPLILQATWIRPEDAHRYEGLIPVMKLATRMHAHPRLVLDAYARGRYRGNLLDLMEPGYGPLLAPYVIDATRLGDDWFDRTSTCGRRCEDCTYCRDVLEGALVEMPAGVSGTHR